MILSPAEALAKREELIQRGYTSIPKVMPADLVEELRAWSDGIFARTHVRYEIRYQGSDLFVYTERGWSAMAPDQRQRAEDDPRRFLHPMATRTIDLPAQLAVCREIGLEHLRSDEVVIILSKPAHGPPLYWHQDFMQWDSPRAATTWSTRRGKTAVCASSPAVTAHAIGCMTSCPMPMARSSRPWKTCRIPPSPTIRMPWTCRWQAGDLLIADARLLHAAWPNRSDRRRTLLLAWHDAFSFPEPPSWWTAEIPAAVRNADPTARYEATRTPSHYIA